MMNSKIAALKKEISILENNLSTKKLSAADKQIIFDKIAEKKREIEKASKEEKKVVSVSGAPKLSNRKNQSRNRFTNNKFYL